MPAQELTLGRMGEGSRRKKRLYTREARNDFNRRILPWKKVSLLLDDPQRDLQSARSPLRPISAYGVSVRFLPHESPVTADVEDSWFVDPSRDEADNQAATTFELREAVDVQVNVQREFEQLASEWKRDTAHLSDPSMIAEHRAYQEIIGMGEEAVPMILRDLEKSPALWFWALRSIAGESPIRPEDRGDIDAMTSAWFDWGRRRRYI